MGSGEDDSARRLTRRDLLRASVVAGGVAAWSAPVVTRVAAAPPTQGSSEPTPR